MAKGEQRRKSFFSPQVLGAVLFLLLFFGLVYYPYEADQWPAKILKDYCAFLASCVAWCLERMGEELSRQGDTIYGRFNLQVILSCGALDVWAMLSAAILATPARWKAKLWGILAGTAAILLANIGRLMALFRIGAKDIERFHFFHEEVFSFVFVGYTLLLYWLWLRVALSRRGTAPHKEIEQERAGEGGA